MASQQVARKVGQPTVMTDDKVQRLELAFMMDLNVVQACQYADIKLNTYHSYIQRNPEYAQRFNELKETPISLAKQGVFKALKDQEPQMLRWYLERKKRDEFGAKTDINIKVEATYTDKQIEARIKQLVAQNNLLDAPEAEIVSDND